MHDHNSFGGNLMLLLLLLSILSLSLPKKFHSWTRCYNAQINIYMTTLIPSWIGPQCEYVMVYHKQFKRLGLFKYRPARASCFHTISRFSNFHSCWYNCISTRKMFYIICVLCFIFKKYKTFSVLIYSYINASGKWKNEKFSGNTTPAAGRMFSCNFEFFQFSRVLI